MRALTLTLGVALLIVGSAWAQVPYELDPATYEPVLVPLNLYVPEGAYGSQWASELWVYNMRAGDVLFNQGNPNCSLPGGCYTASGYAALLPGEITSVQLAPYGLGGVFNIERKYANALRFQMRVSNVSNLDNNLGTEIPVVRESAFLRGRTALLAVPIRRDARIALRLYDPSGGAAGEEFLVRIFAERGTEVLYERRIGIAPRPLSAQGLPFSPGYAEWFSIESLPELVGNERVRIEIEPIALDPPYWAMVSVTNNTTQMVTIISPQ